MVVLINFDNNMIFYKLYLSYIKYSMSTYTSSLPYDLLKQLAEKSGQLSIPKNKIMEKALRIYLNQLEKSEYIKSYKKAKNDPDVMQLSEEGMIEYLKQMDSTNAD